MKILLSVIFTFFSCMSYAQQTFKSNGERTIIDTLGYDSLQQYFYSGKKLFFQVPYKNGKVNGWYEQFHQNGAVYMKELRIDGEIADGYNVSYHDNGVVYQKGYFKNGYQVGKWYHYTDEEKLFKIYYYNQKGVVIKLKRWNEKEKKWERTNPY